MINFKKELGIKYEDLVKCDFIKDLADILNDESLINVDIDDLKNIIDGDIVGSISTIINDVNELYEINKIRDLVPTDCLLNISSSKDMSIKDIENIVTNIRKLGKENMNIILGTSLDNSLDGKIKVQALFSYKK